MSVIKHLFRWKLGYESIAFYHMLPLIKYDINKSKDNRDEYDKEILKNVFEFLDNGNCFMVEKVCIKMEYDNHIKITYRYNGNSGYYDFDLVFYVVYVIDEDKLYLCGTIEQSVHDLFEDIITDNIMPRWVKDFGLSK